MDKLSAKLAHLLTSLALTRPRTVLAAGGLLVLGGTLLGARLSLQTGLAELLPPGAPSVIELKALTRRVGGTGGVAVAISGEPAVLRATVPKLVAALRQELGKDLLAIKFQRKEVDDYFKRFDAWYLPLDELARWASELKHVVADEKTAANPAYVNLDDEPHAAARKLIADVRKAKRSVGLHNEADEESGLLMTENGHLAVLFVRPAANSLNLAASGELLTRIERVVTANLPSGTRLEGFTGSIPSAIEEFKAVERDIAGTALLVIVLVGGGVTIYFRGVRELVLVSGALAIGAAVAFAFAYLWIGHVNAQTAFLGSIIVGTGINYGIILLARYGERRRAGLAFEAAPQEALGPTLRATSLAA